VPAEKVLIVDDESKILRFCDRVLAQQGFDTETAIDGQAALEKLESETYNLLVIDVKMPKVDGLTVLRRALSLDPHLTAVVITGYATIDTAIEALKAGARGFLLKPFGIAELSAAVQSAMDQSRKEQERLRLRARLPILEISQALMAEGEVETLAKSLLEIVARETNAERAMLFLHSPEARALEPVETLGLTAEPTPAHVPLAGGIAGRALDRDEPLGLVQAPQADTDDGLVDDPDSLDLALRPLLIGGETAIALMPLSGRAGLLGLLALGRSAGGQGRERFYPAELSLLSIMGRQIAVALENVRLYRQLKESRDYFRTLLDSLHDQVMVVDRDMVITDVNAIFLEMTGLPYEEVIGHHCYDVVSHCGDPCQARHSVCPAEEVWRTEQVVRGVCLACDSAGKEIIVDVVASPMFDDQGRVVRVINACRDVTSERRLEESLEGIRALGKRLVLSRDDAEIGRTVTDIARRVLGFGVCDLWLVDHAREYLVRRASTATAAGADGAPLPLHGDHGVVSAVVKENQTIYLPDACEDDRPAGRGAEHCSVLAVPLSIGQQVIGALVTTSEKRDAFDAAAQRLFSTLADQAALAIENARLFDQLLQLKEFNEGLVNNMVEGITVQDAEGHLTFLNPAAADMLGYTPQELVGQHWATIVPPEQHPVFERAGERRRAGESDRYEIRLLHRDGSHVAVQVAGRPLFENGAYAGSLSVFSDLTEAKGLQEQLIQSEKLAATGRLAASLAHEINNPLQAIHNGLQILLSFAVDPQEQSEYLKIADREVERLIEMVSRILDFARKPDRKVEPTDAADLVRSVLTLSKKYLQHRSIGVEQEMALDLPQVLAAPGELKQVFLNLVVNAVEAMPDGGTLRIKSRETEDGYLAISFADTGEGIPAQDLEHIFEPFFSTKKGSTGLGLSVSNSLVEAHGGRLTVESEIGVGTTLTVWLPVLTSEQSVKELEEVPA
jgi:PAS domain S-box-containing protein